MHTDNGDSKINCFEYSIKVVSVVFFLVFSHSPLSHNVSRSLHFIIATVQPHSFGEKVNLTSRLHVYIMHAKKVKFMDPIVC